MLMEKKIHQYNEHVTGLSDEVCPRMHVQEVAPGVYTMVPCGKCAVCRKKRANEWTAKLQLEAAISFKTVTGTLTYAPEFLPKEGADKRSVQLFLKRLRYYYKIYGIPSQFKYYIAAEYGPIATRRCHYHYVIFFPDTFELHKEDIQKAIDDAWSVGIVSIDYIGRSVSNGGYCTNYITGDQEVPPLYVDGEFIKRNDTFHLFSKGLGFRALKEGKVTVIDNHVALVNEQYLRIPKYYIKKLNMDESFSKASHRFLIKKYIVDTYGEDFYEQTRRENYYFKELPSGQKVKIDCFNCDIKDIWKFARVPHIDEVLDCLECFDYKKQQYLKSICFTRDEIEAYRKHVDENIGYYQHRQWEYEQALKNKHWKEPKKKQNMVLYQSAIDKQYKNMLELKRQDRRKIRFIKQVS